MKPDSTLSNVVLPVPVPPETSTFIATLDGCGEQRRNVVGHRAHLDQVGDLERVLGELANGQDRAVQRERWDDDVDA